MVERALIVALYWRAAWQDSNPDVGMGPSLESLLDRVIEEAQVTIAPSGRTFILNATRNRLNEHGGRRW